MWSDDEAPCYGHHAWVPCVLGGSIYRYFCHNCNMSKSPSTGDVSNVYRNNAPAVTTPTLTSCYGYSWPPKLR